MASAMITKTIESKKRRYTIKIKRLEDPIEARTFKDQYQTYVGSIEEDIFLHTVFLQEDDPFPELGFPTGGRFTDVSVTQRLSLEDIFDLASVFRFHHMECPDPEYAIRQLIKFTTNLPCADFLRLDTVHVGYLHLVNISTDIKLTKPEIEASMNLNANLFNPEDEVRSGKGSRKWRAKIERKLKEQFIAFGGMYAGI
jgi:hypothetical protein